MLEYGDIIELAIISKNLKDQFIESGVIIKNSNWHVFW